MTGVRVKSFFYALLRKGNCTEKELQGNIKCMRLVFNAILNKLLLQQSTYAGECNEREARIHLP